MKYRFAPKPANTRLLRRGNVLITVSYTDQHRTLHVNSEHIGGASTSGRGQQFQHWAEGQTAGLASSAQFPSVCYSTFVLYASFRFSDSIGSPFALVKKSSFLTPTKTRVGSAIGFRHAARKIKKRGYLQIPQRLDTGQYWRKNATDVGTS